ncbi:MAG: exopolysaccharide biosynthesis polyprenyl glycosylphosphotransferase [Patescibacteria group bacterium]
MNTIHRKDHSWALLGDILVLFVALFLTLVLRYGGFPSAETWAVHIPPFSILFILAILINFISGLYEKHTLLFKKRLPTTLFNVQLVNAVISIAFFYFIEYFSITPKIVLFVYLLLSLLLMLLWRIFILPRFGGGKLQKALLIGESSEIDELKNEIAHNPQFNISFVAELKPSQKSVDLKAEIIKLLTVHQVSVVVIDSNDEALSEVIPMLYPFALSRVLFFDVSSMYEAMFDRIPLSHIKQNWFIENMASIAPKFVYDMIKRGIDFMVALVLGIISLVIYPFVILAIKLDDRGVIFSYQERVGRYNKILKIMKFRTMTVADDKGKWGSVPNKVTRVGRFLRMTRIDELPQLWNVLKGDISLIGPRPEFPEPVQRYAEALPYYNIRHSIKPGLSGWAQIYGEHPHHGVDMDMTANKLSYDLYYVKNRSFLIDLKIALRTIKVLITFVGR